MRPAFLTVIGLFFCGTVIAPQSCLGGANGNGGAGGTLRPTQPPIASDATVSVDENIADGTQVHIVSATDPDVGDVLSYTITGGNTNAAFAIDGNTGAITVNNSSALDFESTPSFALTVRVSDGSLSDDALITINLTNVNETPSAADATVGIPENTANGSAVHTVSATDPDAGAALSYVITGGNTNTAFQIDSNTGAITVNNSSALDFESTSSFALTVRVSEGTLFDDALITVNLINANDVPSAADATVSLAENTANGTSVHTVIATDQDAGDVLTYAITAGNTNTAFAINASSGAITVNNSAALDFETTPSFPLTVRVSDGSLFHDALITVNLTNVNESHTVTDATVGLAENAANGTTVHTVSVVDPDAAPVYTYAITAGNSSAAFAINTSTGEITVNNSSVLDFETITSFTLKVQVNDGTFTDDATITINLINVNEYTPEASGATVSIIEHAANGTVAHTVTGTDADAGAVLTYTIIAGNTEDAFGINPNTGVIRVENFRDVDFEKTPTFVLTVRVSDGTLFRDVFIIVNVNNVNEAPSATDATVTLAEHAATGTAVHSVSATDPDAGTVLTYSITAGNTGTAFAINTNTGAITVNNSSAVNFETTPSFSLTVRVSDGSLFDDALIKVNLTNVNDAPSAADATVSLAENAPNGTAVHTVSATDQDVGAVLSYSITGGNTGTAFAINASTGAITVNNSSALNFETTASFSLTVRVSDGTLFDDALITVNLTNVNEAPPSAADATTSIAENTANATVVHNVSATDPDAGAVLTFSIMSGNTDNAFAINASTGAITVNNSGALNFESTPSFALTVRVSDGSFFDDALITVNLTNVNEAPSAADATVTLAENAGPGTVVHTVSGSDPDAGAMLTYALTGGNTDAAFAINTGTGAITANNAAAIDFEATSSFALTVRVSDGSLFHDALVTVNLTDINEVPSAADATVTLPENSANGTPVHTVSASDPDAGAILTYVITEGNASGAFAINSNSGAITVNNAAALDFETTSAFALTVEVGDGSSSAEATIQVNVEDVNETPAISSATVSISENAPNGTLVYAVQSSDPDQPGDVLVYSIVSGNADNAFVIGGDGRISVNNASALDFETSGTFTIVIRVSDGEFSADAPVTINLQDINEPPRVSSATISIDEGLEEGTIIHRVAAVDADANDVISFSLAQTTEVAVFSIDANTGDLIIQDAEQMKFDVNPALQVTVQAMDLQGATGIGTIDVHLNKVTREIVIEPLKGFSPNGDRNNDFWLIKGIENFPENEVKVFNRWGNLVFQTSNYDNEETVWRGEANQPLVLGGDDPTDNTYFFIIHAGDLEPISGYVIVKK